MAGVLGGRGFPLEQAAAQVCSTFVHDMDPEEVRVLDGRRLEVEETDFGQSRFGHLDLTNFWPIQF